MDQKKKHNKGYFTTGEFAKLCGINKQTLFHYDRIGILKPELTGNNGYRYYSYLQLDSYNTIAMLKELDMPLSDIKKYLNTRNPHRFLQLLEQQEKEVEEKIAELQWLKTFIKERIHITMEGIAASHQTIQLEHRAQEYYIITEYSGGSSDRDIYPALAEHLMFCHQDQMYSPYAIGGLIPVAQDFLGNNDYEYSHFYSRVPPADAPDSQHVTCIEPGSYLVAFSTEGYESLPSLCQNLLDYADAHGYRPGSHLFEDALLDDMSCFDFDHYTIKLSLPVCKKQ